MAAESMTMHEAARYLGVSSAKMWRLVKEGALVARENPLDRRQKLIRRDDVEGLRTNHASDRGFVSDGSDADPVDIPASRIKDWIRENWHGSSEAC